MPVKKIYIFVFLFACIATKHAISFPDDPPAAAAYVFPKPEGDWEVLTIPLKRAGNLFLLEARIDTLSGNFILDTGAPHLVLNQTYFRNSKMSDGATAMGIGGAGKPVMRYTADSLVINSLRFSRVPADVTPMGHLENVRGIKILGLLGSAVFYDMEMELDAENNTLTLYKTDKQGNRISQSNEAPMLPDLMLPIQLFNDALILEGSIAGKKLKFIFDTGAEVNVLDLGVPDKVLSQFSLTARRSVSGATNTKVEVLNGQIKETRFAQATFKEMPFILTELSHLQQAYGLSIQGILGYDFLSKGRVIINMKKKLFIMYFYTEEAK